jgi:ABC-type Zn uptake system ZnuABC Zn-binding protein ZnuA
MDSLRFLSLLLAVVLLAGCESKAKTGGGEKPVVVATTTMLADLAGQIGGDDVVVRGIMKPGGDPHLYQPTPGDARTIASSDMVITSGLHLEGWIDDLVRNAGGERPVVVASEGVDPIRMEDSPGGVDPHFWFDLQAWKIATDNVGDGVLALVEPGSAAAARIDARRKEYRREIDSLHAWTNDRLQSVPESRRVLITSHDAFGYFGRAYGIDVVGIQGISTEQEASQRDVANVVDVVRERGAPAVFVETSVNPQLIEQVARETGVKVAGPLYSDSIGPADSAASTFVGTVSENVRIITEALGGTYVSFETSSKPTVESVAPEAM